MTTDTLHLPLAPPTGHELAPLAPLDRTSGSSIRGTEPAGAAAESAWWWNRIAVTVLPCVAAVGAALSWESLYQAAAVALGAHSPAPFGINLAGAGFPLLVDALILGASARYVAGIKTGRPVAGWRLAAHAGVAGTVALNVAASPRLADVPWHVTAPIVWSVLVELVARDVLGELRRHTAAGRPAGAGGIPVRLWVTAPAESIRVSWRLARTKPTSGDGDGSAVPLSVDGVRAVTERCAAARDHLIVSLPGRRYRRLRRQIIRRLWSGALDPGTLANLVDVHTGSRASGTPGVVDALGLHRAVLRTVATGPGTEGSGGTESRTESGTAGRAASRPAVGPGLPGPSPGSPGPSRTRSGPEVRAGSAGPASRPDRQVADLARVVATVLDGDLTAPITKAKVRALLRCSNPHAGAVNALYQRHLASTEHVPTHSRAAITETAPKDMSRSSE